MTNQEKIQRLHALGEEIEAYGRTLGKLNFDLECCAPEEGMEKAGEDMAIIGKQLYALQHAPEYEQLIVELHEDHEGLDFLDQKVVEQCYKQYCKTKNFTPEFAYQRDVAMNKAYGEWLTAKKAGDYSLYRDTMASLIDFTRKAVELRDEHPEKLYDACLDDYESCETEEHLDRFFAELKERIQPLTARIVKEGKPIRSDFLSRLCPIPQQEAFSKYLLEKEGLRKTALVLMTTEHPFTTNFGPKDVRVTTHYSENNFISNIFTTMHEGGHALFMQNEPEEFYAHHADNMMTNGMHECISRFYENLIGRSEAFVHFIYPKLLELTGDTFKDITERELYEAINIVNPSLVRTEADELTYCLHIMIRYELEKAFMDGAITVDEIPALWNQKYKEYLGVEPKNDGEGCLQDVHWTGMFGYFPSYALGNAYGAQILNRMKMDFDVYEAVANGELYKVTDWMKKNVFSCASIMTPDEWIRKITGEPLNTAYYLDYLEEKYTKLYELK